MTALASRFLESLTGHHLEALKAFANKKTDGRVAYGTMCSGTDVASVCNTAMSGACTKAGIDLELRQNFACEKDTTQQTFLMTAYPDLPQLFGDIADMVHGRAMNFMTEGDETVSVVEGAIIGFPCTDVSGLNNNAKHETNRNCIANKNMRTGKVFSDILDFVKSAGDNIQRCA